MEGGFDVIHGIHKVQVSRSELKPDVVSVGAYRLIAPWAGNVQCDWVEHLGGPSVSDPPN